MLVANKLGQKLDRILRSYLKSNNPKKYELFAIAFQNFNGDWLNEFYLKMLNIKSSTKIKSPIPVYWPVNKDLRICDIAAYSLKLKNAELKFDLSAPLSDRNVQITDIIKQLSK